MAASFYWHDYETWGADPTLDRAAQFAGVRTDGDLNPIEAPLVLYCQPPDDLLPHPEACLLTGISPQRALEQGVPEAEFIARIHQELARPGTCGVGYNSLRFDDELTRFTLYRNFYDPYAREWQNGNSRWDLIDVLRLAHALRPAGLEWPSRADGSPSFRLEDLGAANGIDTSGAHDALADVRCCIDLARLLKGHQPRLFDHALGLRDKRRVAELVNLAAPKPLLHVSSKYPATLGCLAPVWPLAPAPGDRNGLLLFDLRQDPQILFDLDAAALRERVFSSRDQLPEGSDRVPIKTLHLNRSPMLAPMGTLTPEAAQRWQIDPAQVLRHGARLLADGASLGAKLAEAFARPNWPARDPEQDLYGGFLNDGDRRLAERVRATAPEYLAAAALPFQDRRLPVLLLRHRARNWPDTLTDSERRHWDEFRRRRLTDPDGGGTLTLDQYRELIASLAQERRDPAAMALLDALLAWGERLEQSLGPPGSEPAA